VDISIFSFSEFVDVLICDDKISDFLKLCVPLKTVFSSAIVFNIQHQFEAHFKNTICILSE